MRVQDDNPDLRHSTSALLGEPVTGYFKQAEPDHDPFIVSLDVAGGPLGYSDRVRILFSDEATHGLDLSDAPKLASSDLSNQWLSLYALDGQGEAYAIRSLPLPSDALAQAGMPGQDQLTIPIGIETTEAGIYTMSWQLPSQSTFRGSFYLRDTQTGTLTELRDGQTYRFELESDKSSDHFKWSDDSSPGSGLVHSSVHGQWTGEGEARFELILSNHALDQGHNMPTSISLAQNYPNPFNPSTIISYELPETGHVRLAIYDMTGRHVATLVDSQMAAGHHQVTFNAMNLSSGVYMYRLQAGGRLLTRQLTLIK